MLSPIAAAVVFCSITVAQTPAPPDSAASPQSQSGVRAGFWWADYDRDGLDDAFVVGADGAARLLHNLGDGSFADVTMISGLDALGASSFAAWQDFDRDGAPDVFVGTQSGPGHLLRNAGDGTFQDVTQFVGLTHSGRHVAAQWFDYDLDGLIDFAVRTDAGEHLYHALPNGHFEAVDLGTVKAPPILRSSSDSNDDIGEGVSVQVDLGKPEERKPAVHPPGVAGNAMLPTRTLAAPLAPPPGSYFVSACPPKILDSSNSSCLQASSAPTLGMLYPLTINLNVSAGGNVGIGTTTPAAKLEVSGTAKITDTLTLSPASDQALDVSTGSIYKGGALFAHTKGGAGNTALGKLALSSVTTGLANTANGYRALNSDTTGTSNTAFGYRALASNTNGSGNTATGYRALASGATANRNTAAGGFALYFNSTGNDNTASGYRALYANTTADRNTASGSLALTSNTTGKDNTANGHQALGANTIGEKNTAAGSRALANNTSGSINTAGGAYALRANTIGSANTAFGSDSLRASTSGIGNTSIGAQALQTNTTGYQNLALGNRALYSNVGGGNNTACGGGALFLNSSGTFNTGCGEGALRDNTTGARNIALGANAGQNLTTGNDNIAIGNLGIAGEQARIRIGTAGTHVRTFVAGIRGVTTVNANAIPVLIDSVGQLGTVSSSRRFKKDIVDMGDATSRLLELRPVRFRYKQEQTMPDGSEVPMEYGLIAEEVAEVFPDLVVYGDDGKPFTVKYHILSSMLLNELKKLEDRIETQELAHERELDELRTRLGALEARASEAPNPRKTPTGSR